MAGGRYDSGPDTQAPTRTVIIRRKRCQGQTSQSFVNIVERNAKSAYFRHFLPEYRASDVGFRARLQAGWPQFEISYTLPSACARALLRALPILGLFQQQRMRRFLDLQILPDVAIASRRAVRSILLVSQIPVELVRTVALDTSSMTSVALTKILFEKWLGGGRTFSRWSLTSRKCWRSAMPGC